MSPNTQSQNSTNYHKEEGGKPGDPIFRFGRLSSTELKQSFFPKKKK